MRQHTYIFTYGFALFAMFFGSGNLVFPLQIGSTSGSSWLVGFAGLLITGIMLPFLGLFVIKLHKGSYDSFFSEAGAFARIALPLFTLSLLGSFGVVPRCITVAHGGMSYLYPEISLMLFSIGFSVMTYFLCLKDQFMVNILGKWMSPILLTTLLALIIIGFAYAPETITEPNASAAFINGFLTGSQTMDLFAAFFFAALIFAQIQHTIPKAATTRQALLYTIKPSILGATILGMVYLGLVFLGAHYSHLLENVDPELMLPTIAENIMGDNATMFIGIAMLLSCLTTAVALNNIYARYICSTIGLSEKRFPLTLLATTALSFVVSLLDFKGIAAFLAPALEISYPGIIGLTVMSIATRKFKILKQIMFYSISAIMIVIMIL